MKHRLGFDPVIWPGVAQELGFAQQACTEFRVRGDSPLQSSPLQSSSLQSFSLQSEGNWLALVDWSSESVHSLSDGLGTPGLWRVVRVGANLKRVHDLPPLCRDEQHAGSGPIPGALAPLAEWAAATRKGQRLPDWTPPPREEVISWFDASRLNLRSGALLAKGELVHQCDALALVFPELVVVPQDLSPARRSWLDDFLLDAQSRWRLVRFGIDPNTRAVRAEVDLTGLPLAVARPFVQLALEALAWAVVWVLSPLSFLVDTRAQSRALDRHSYHSLNRSLSS